MKSIGNGSMNQTRKMFYSAYDPHTPKFYSAVILKLILLNEDSYVKV